MPLFNRKAKTEQLVADIVKALQGSPMAGAGYANASVANPWAPSGSGQGIIQVAGEVAALPRPGVGSPQTPGFGAMLGPSAPLIPALIDDPLDETGRAMPRKYEYQVAKNLNLTQQEVPFEVLRRLAEQCDIIHRCIEIRVADLQKMDWSFGPSAQALDEIMAEQNVSHAKAARIFRDKYGEEIARLEAFWSNPYVHQDRGWQEWLSEALWQVFVFDGLAIYPRYNLGGDKVLGFDIIDSPTIKPLLDNRGERPFPPLPAYQQILWGFPRGEFIASPAEEVSGEYVDGMKGRLGRTDSLAYFIMNRRTWSPYGYSPTEQAIPAAALYLDRQNWMRSEFQYGSTPMTWMKSNSQEMDPNKLANFERILNDQLTGSTAERHRVKLLPDGFDPVAMPSIEERYKPEYDEFIIKRIASCFGVAPSQLGVISRAGLGGGKGAHEGEQESSETVSMRPMVSYVEEVINNLSRRFLQADKNITFILTDDTINRNDEIRAKAFQVSLASGQMTLNDVRGELGMPLYDDPAADEPFMATPAGPVYFRGTLAVDESGETIGQTDEATPSKAEPSSQGDQPEAQGNAAVSEVETNPAGLKAVEAELQAFVKFATSRIKKGQAHRDFLFRTIDEEDAWALNQDVQAIIKGETFTPPKGVQEAAQKALEWLKEGKAGDGFTAVGRKRASDLARGAGVSMATLRRMKAYFDRHQSDKDSPNWNDPSPGKVAWYAWGGDAGYSWAKSKVGESEKGATPGDTPKVPEASTTKRKLNELPNREGIEQVEDKHKSRVNLAIQAGIAGWEKALAEAMKANSTEVVAAILATHVTFGTELEVVLRSIYEDATGAAREWTKEQLATEAPSRALPALLDRAGIVLRGINDTTLERIGTAIKDGIVNGSTAKEIGTAINAVIDNPTRADIIAITETNRAYNAEAIDQYQQAGVTEFEWLAYDGACEECLDQEGTHSLADEYPPLHPNCRCAVVPVVEQ